MSLQRVSLRRFQEKHSVLSHEIGHLKADNGEADDESVHYKGVKGILKQKNNMLLSALSLLRRTSPIQ